MEKDIAFLEKNWKRMSDVEMSRILEYFSPRQVQSKRAEMGWLKHDRTPFVKDEDVIREILKLFPNHTFREIARKLNLTMNQANNYRSHLVNKKLLPKKYNKK